MTSTISDAYFRRVLDVLGAIASPKVGILRRSLLLPLVGGQVPLSHFTAAVANYDALPTGRSIANPGASSWDTRVAVVQVVFEALERYCAAFVDYGALLKSTPSAESFAGGKIVQQFAAEQYGQPEFPFKPITDESSIYWATGRSLYSGDRRFVPASLTYLPYQPATPDEILGPSFSTGMAASWNRADAVLNGLLELVERDSFMVHWMNGAAGEVLIPEPESRMARILDTVEADGNTQVTFTDLSTDLQIPVVCALTERTTFGRTVINIGLSCKLNEEDACEKALSEALSDYERIRFAIETGAADEWNPGENFENVTDFEWHGMLYSRSEHHHALTPLRGSGSTRPIRSQPVTSSAQQALDAVLQQLEPHVSDVIAVDLTTRDIADFGVRVVKVFAPELVPLNSDHKYPYLGHERLRTAIPSPAADLNHYPHPFS